MLPCSALDRLHHAVLGCGVQRAGRFVQHQHRRVVVQRARDADALALAAREADAALADHGVEPFGRLRDELLELRGPDRARTAASSICSSGRPNATLRRSVSSVR